MRANVKAILVVELRGFEAMAIQLAKEGDAVGLTSERIRASSVAIMNGLFDQAAALVQPEVRFHVGGDTWYFNFEKLDDAIRFASNLCRIARDHAANFGTFFLKPSLAINIGVPKLDGERFLDDYSILAYRFADGGKSYSLRLVGGALEKAIQSGEWPIIRAEDAKLGPFGDIHWDQIRESGPLAEVKQVAVPRLLLDSDIQYSDGTSEAIELMLRQQERASSILSFGGPAPINQPLYRHYIKSMIASLRLDETKKATVLSYIPLDEPVPSFGWLEICRRLAYLYPGRFAFAAFAIPQGQLRPFAYHIYDGRIVYVGLRSFSPQRGTATLSAGIIFRAQQVAHRFRDELHENFRKVGAMDDSKFAAITSSMPGLTPDLRRNVLLDVEAIFAS
jgi:hypothetical protein